MLMMAVARLVYCSLQLLQVPKLLCEGDDEANTPTWKIEFNKVPVGLAFAGEVGDSRACWADERCTNKVESKW